MNEEQAKQYVNEKCKGLPVTSEEDARKVLDIIWQACCEWRDSQDAQINQQLVRALERIAAIEDQLQGGDWDEIEEAREIAKAAIEAAQNGGKRN